MDIDKLFESESLDGIADNVFGVVNNSVSEVKEMQRKKVAENVQLVVNALKKIESDISSRYDSVGNALEKRIITIKDGRDGADGRDGRNGKDGKNGRDGAPGPRGADGKNGLDGADGTDGVSVTNAHIDFDGSLVISLSSGHEINVGEVVAPALAEQIKVITNGGGTSQSVIDTLASLQAQITALGTAAAYKGLWNASTNTPTLASGVGTSGNFYIVSVAGSTNLDGITNWGVGDWAIYNGTAWQRVEGGAAGNFTTVTASSLTSGRVTYAGTAGLLQDSANLTFNGTTLTAGGFTTTGATATGTLSTTSFGVFGARTQIKGTNADITGATGSGTEIFGGSTPGLLAYNRDGSAYLPLTINALTVALQAEGTTRGLFSSTGAAITGTFSSTLGATIYGLTVGRGGGAVSTNTAVGASALAANTTGDINVAVGYLALAANTSGRQCVAVGKSALAVNNGDLNVAIGESALSANTSGTQNTGCGSRTLTNVVTGSYNSALGYAALNLNTGSNNVGVGVAALSLTTTANGNTAVGYQALRQSNRVADTNAYNLGVGYQAGEGLTTGQYNTFVGGSAPGWLVTSGSKNTILGNYNGNQGGLDIRTASNYVVLSDGDGNIVASSKTAQTFALQGGTLSAGTGIAFPATQSASSNANTLDDYEEGNATLTLDGSTTSPTTPITVSAFYTKIGKQVVIEFSFESVNTTGASGNIKITGLPFPIDAATTPMGVVSITGLGVIVPVLRGRYTYGTTGIGLMSAIDVTSPITMIAGTAKYVFGSLTYFT